MSTPSLPGPPEAIEVILVPLDGSPLSELALPVASSLARRFDAGVHLLSAVPTADDVAEREAQLSKLELSAKFVEREVVINLDPAGAVHDRLVHMQKAVICMATRGRGRSAAIFGSVADDVIFRCRDALVLAGRMLDPRLPGTGVILCVDETPASAALLPIAWRWSELLHEPLTVMTVAEPVPEPFQSGTIHRRFGPDGDVDGYLSDLVRALRAEGKEVQTKAIYDPISPAEGILAYLDAHPPYLVVAGTHARTGLARLALGSTAAAVVHSSPAPVLAIPRPDIQRKRDR
ncbi:MAG TPA: universal stress protein [Acidimicrobiales bacterium]|nr:universal stress protein [Acidimicrobiales bacterium]